MNPMTPLDAYILQTVPYLIFRRPVGDTGSPSKTNKHRVRHQKRCNLKIDSVPINPYLWCSVVLGEIKKNGSQTSSPTNPLSASFSRLIQLKFSYLFIVGCFVLFMIPSSDKSQRGGDGSSRTCNDKYPCRTVMKGCWKQRGTREVLI